MQACDGGKPASFSGAVRFVVEQPEKASSMTTEGKRIAKYAAVGALIGLPAPIIGPFIGGAIGAYLAHRKNQRLTGRSY